MIKKKLRDGRGKWMGETKLLLDGKKSVEKMKRETTRLHIFFLHVTCDGILASCVRSTSTSSM